MKHKRIRILALLLALMMLLPSGALAAEESEAPEAPAAEETAPAPAEEPAAPAPEAEEPAAVDDEETGAEEGSSAEPAEEPEAPGNGEASPETAFTAMTRAVDNSVRFRDGRYTGEVKYTADGGAAALKVSAVRVRNSHAFAELKFDDAAYTLLDASGKIFSGEKGAFSGVPAAIGGKTELRVLNGKTGEIFRYSAEIAISSAAKGPIRKGPGVGRGLPGFSDALSVFKQKTLSVLKGDVKGLSLEDGQTELAVTNNTTMFKIADTAVLDKDGKTLRLTVSFTTDTFEKAYLGYAEDAETAAESALIAREGDDFTFVLGTGALRTPFTVSFRSSKGWKSQRQFTIDADAATLTVDTAPEKTELAVTNNTSMFKIADTARLEQKDDAVRLTVSFTTDTFLQAYYGYAEDAEAAAESELIDRDGDSFTFMLSGAALTEPFTVSFRSSKGWKSERQFTIDTEAATLTVDTAPEKPAATELAVTNNTTMFKIADTATLDRAGDSVKLTVSFTTDTFEKAYLGYAEDAETAAESELIDREGDSFTFTLTSTALTKPFVVSFQSSKGWKSERQFTIDVDAATLTVDTAPEKPAEGGEEEEEQPESDTNGSTAVVDNSTILPDGTYTPDKFTWSGGSGRASITCEKVIVQGGKSYAVITIDSAKYVYIKASGQTFYTTHSGKTSTATIPIRLNVTNTIIGMTTAMSVPHEIKYYLYVYIAAAEKEKDTTEREDQKIPGLTYLSTDENADAGLFSVYRYKDGYALIRVPGVGRYLIVPEGKETPEPLDEDVYVVKQPVKQAYVADEERFSSLWDAADGSLREAITMTGFERSGEETKFAGAYDALELAQLLRSRCGLAVLPAVCADQRVTGWDAADPEAVVKDELGDEDAAELARVFSALQGYGIPGFVDRSADEETELGALEWLKLYGILFGCEESMKLEYDELAAAIDPAAA